MHAAGGPCTMQLLCGILSPDRKRDEENLLPPGKGNYFAKKSWRGFNPHSSGDIKNVGKTEKIGSALRKGSGQYKKKKKEFGY